MSLSVYFHGAPDGDGGPFALASASGWAAVGEWVEGLDQSFDALHTFLNEGEVKGTDRLSRQLKAALKAHPPSKAVRATLQGLQDVLGVGDSEETATVLE